MSALSGPQDEGLAKWRANRDGVVCPSCGLPAHDAGIGSKPRWTCPDVRCLFSAGWRLEFSDMENPDSSSMVAVPLGSDESEAVAWPRGSERVEVDEA